MGLPITALDADHDGELSRDEMFEYVSELQDAAGDVTSGLPGWFFELDEDRDGQVALHEFSEERSLAKIEEFAAIDLNDDGLLTASEVLQSKAVTGGSYRNDKAEVLPPHRTIISEIEVDDDFLIRDLNVQISITHSNTGFLDAYLTGPQGERVELFSEVGGSGNHFEKTIFDDQSAAPITKARAPFEGTYRPEAIDNRQPGLYIFNNKSAKGVWQLIIRGSRSERFGMLHSWGLTIQPVEQIPTVSDDTEPQASAEENGQTSADKQKLEKSSEEVGKSIFEQLTDQFK